MAFGVVGKDVVALDAPVDSRKRNVVAVERRATFVIDRAIGGEVGLRRSFTALQSCDIALDGFDRPADSFLNEVRGEVGFVPQLVVQGTFGFGLRGNVVSVVAMSTPFARGVRTVFELLDRLAEGRIGVLRHVELDYGGTTVFHDVSHNVAVLLKRSRVGLPKNVVHCGTVGSSPPTPFASFTPLRKRPPPRDLGETGSDKSKSGD